MTKHPASDGSGKTQQQFKDDADINKIMKRHRETGVVQGPMGRRAVKREPMFGDFVGIDFTAALNAVTDIKNAFQQLPPRMRNMFQGDPAQVLRFIDNPKNRKEAIKMGLIPPTEEERIQLEDEQAAAAARATREAREAAGQQNLVKADPEAQPGFRKSAGEKGANSP